MRLQLADSFSVATELELEKLCHALRMPGRDSAQLARCWAGKINAEHAGRVLQVALSTRSTPGGVLARQMSTKALQHFGAGGAAARALTDLTAALPVASLVDHGTDLPRLTPRLAGSGVGIQQLNEIFMDHLLTEGVKQPLRGNGVYTPEEAPSVAVTREGLERFGITICEPERLSREEQWARAIKNGLWEVARAERIRKQRALERAQRGGW